MKPALALLALVGLVLETGSPSGAQTAISVDGVVEVTSGGFRFPDGRIQPRAAAAGPAPVEDTGQRRCYAPSTVGTEIPCGGTGQDGEIQAGADWPAPRFTDNQDGTVTDNLTELIWLKDAGCLGSNSFAGALFSAKLTAQGVCSLDDGSAVGAWRLPNVRELASLLDHGQPTPPILPSGHPFIDVKVDDEYWSSTTYSAGTFGNFAWVVNLFGSPTGNPFFDSKGSENLIWPVRGGQATQASAAHRAGTAASADGAVESTTGGFEFPDGSIQVTAATPGAPVAVTGQTTCYDSSTGANTDCAGTGQDGEFQAGVAWPAPRFVDNLNGTVTDKLTGLIWLQDASCTSIGSVFFASALTATSNLEQGFCNLTDGSSPGDWRVPNIKELLSLADYEQDSPAVPLVNPFVGLGNAGGYWSSTTSALDSSLAWTIRFDEPYTFAMDKSSSSTLLVWPVKGGR